MVGVLTVTSCRVCLWMGCTAAAAADGAAGEYQATAVAGGAAAGGGVSNGL